MGRESAPWPKTTPPQGGFFLAGPMVSLMGAEAEVTAMGAEYMHCLLYTSDAADE